MTTHFDPLKRRFMSTAAATLLSYSMLGQSAIAAVPPAVVKTGNGLLRGRRDNGVYSFKGVPYAADTSGANRFKPPQPVPNWSGEREATQYGPLAPQVKSDLGGPDDIFDWYAQPEPLGEACCVLNVFTPGLDAGARRPVMFYIHGGGYINGGGSGTGVDGSNLAGFGDVVVVTVNHRLNAFGYSDLSSVGPEYADSANIGHLDLVAALQWVRDNIAQFGGDPGCVTLFGQSGGGSKITILLAMPQAKGLFHRAISMSGAAGLNIDLIADMKPYTDALVAGLGAGPGKADALSALTFEQILAMRTRAVAASGVDGARPVIDGRHILHRPMSAEGLKTHAHVPLMLGTTRTEASLFFKQDMRNFSLTAEQMQARMRAVFKIDDAEVRKIAAAYHASDPAMTPSDIFVAVASDVQFRLPLTAAAELRSRSAGQAPVYLYNFNWTIPYMGGILGSPHAVDIPFAFGNVDKALAMAGPGDAAHETSMNMMAAFVAFARTGDPNNARMPAWQAYDGRSRSTMLIDARCTAVSDYRGPARVAASALKIDPFNRAAIYRFQD